MRKSSNFALLLALAAAAGAQETASVTGKVTNSLTGAPIPRAHVIVQGEKRYGAMTDGDGKYSITGVTPGGYRISAERVGFGRSTDLFTSQLALRAGEEKSALNLALTPLGGIAGRVLDADGEPVQMANVSAQGALGEKSAVTDSKGQFHINGLDRGSYRVKAWIESRHLPPEILTDGSKEVHYVATYYPGVQKVKEAAQVAVASGAEASGIDIPLRTSPIVKVSGKILDIPAGDKDVEVLVSANEPDSAGEFGVNPKADGSFVIWGLDPGKYSIKAQKDAGNGVSLMSAPVDLEVGTSDVDRVELRMVPAFDISGQVQFENDADREKLKDNPREVSLGSLNGEGSVEAEIAADGSFKLENVQPDKYAVAISLGDEAYVKSLRLGPAENGEGILDVRSGSGGAALTLLVSTAVCAISGTVSDSNGPAAGAMVVIMREGFTPGRGSMRRTRFLMADASGRYAETDLLPGTYRLLAVEPNNMPRLALSSSFDGEDATVVTLQAGDHVTKDLKLAGR